MQHRMRRCPARLLAVVACATAPASGQERIFKSFGDQNQERFGATLSATDDVTGDGVPDLLIGAPNATTDHGMVRALSGKDGSSAWSLFGNPGEGLAGSITTLGDVDGDGVADFVATSFNPPLGNPGGGGFTLYSGATRAALWTVLGGTNEKLFGHVVAMSDLDGDGIIDFAVAPWPGGDVRVVSGTTGALLYLLTVPTGAGYFGFSIASGGDVDGDGFADLVLGDPYSSSGGNGLGSAMVYSGKSGTLLYELDGAAVSSYFGQSVALMHDADQDGFADVVVGAPYDSVGSGGIGRVHVFSGISGTPLLDVGTSRYTYYWLGFGNGVADAGDMNHDGFGDFFVFESWGGEFENQYNNLSQVILYSGRDGGRLYHYYDPECTAPGYGSAIQLTPDLDGDGIADVAISSPSEDDSSQKGAGAAGVWRGDDLFVDALPRIATFNSTVTLNVGQGQANAPYALFLVDVLFHPVNVLVAYGSLDGTGRAQLSGTAPIGLQGFTFGFKAWTLDANSKLIDSGVETLYMQ